MEAKKFSAGAMGSAGLLLALNVLANLVKNFPLLTALNTVLSPLLLIAAVVCGYLAFQDKASYAGKWIWVVLGLLLGAAAMHLGDLIFCFRAKGDFLTILAEALYVAGGVAAVLALADQKFFKILIPAFCVLAAGALIGSIEGTLAIFEILLYAALVLLVRGEFAERKHIVRTVAVVLAVLSVSSLGVIAAGWIVFAFILVPARKCACKPSLKKVTAVLCILAVLASLGLYVAGEPVAAVKLTKNRIESTQDQIANKEDFIVTREGDILGYQQDLTQAQQDLETAKTEVTAAATALEKRQNDLKSANAALDLVCTRTSYYWRYCTDDCRPLHNTVSACEDAVEDQQYEVERANRKVEDLEDRITTLEDNIKTAQQDIADAKAAIEELKEELAALRNQIVADWFVILVQFVALVLSLGALVLFAKCFFKEMDDKLLLFACGAMGLGALLFLVAGSVGMPKYLYRYLANPYLWTVAIAGFFALALTKKDGKPTTFRLLAVLAAVLVFAFGFAAGVTGIAGCTLYAATVICIAFVLVPLVFTEYNGIGKHIFLSFITLGIWQMVWVYNVTKNLNKVSGAAERKPARELLLSLFLPFYYSFWLLKTGENVEAYGKEQGKEFKLDIVCLVFAFVCPLVSTVLIQNKINLIVGKPE